MFSCAVDKPDPYVALSLGAQSFNQYRTRTLYNEQNPKWNEDFLLLVVDPPPHLLSTPPPSAYRNPLTAPLS